MRRPRGRPRRQQVVRPPRRWCEIEKTGCEYSHNRLILLPYFEREKGFEPSTSTLARSHSTTELLPHSLEGRASRDWAGRGPPGVRSEAVRRWGPNIYFRLSDLSRMRRT